MGLVEMRTRTRKHSLTHSPQKPKVCIKGTVRLNIEVVGNLGLLPVLDNAEDVGQEEAELLPVNVPELQLERKDIGPVRFGERLLRVEQHVRRGEVLAAQRELTDGVLDVRGVQG